MKSMNALDASVPAADAPKPVVAWRKETKPRKQYSKRRTFSLKTKRAAALRVANGETANAVARDLAVVPSMISTWCRLFGPPTGDLKRERPVKIRPEPATEPFTIKEVDPPEDNPRLAFAEALEENAKLRRENEALRALVAVYVGQKSGA